MTVQNEIQTGNRASEAEGRLRSLLLKGLDGDAGAYHAFRKQLSALLRGYFRGRLARMPDEIEDLVQETLLAIHNQRRTYDSAQPLTAWVHAIARYKLIDLFRRRAGREALHTPLDEELAIFAASHTEASDARRDLTKLLAALPERQRWPIVHVKLDGLSHLADAGRFRTDRRNRREGRRKGAVEAFLESQCPSQVAVMPLLFYDTVRLASILIARALDHQNYQIINPPDLLWSYIPAFITSFLMIGLMEEFGWRGYALPRFQAKWNALTSCLILGVIWTCWHISFFFVPGAELYGRNFFEWAPWVVLSSVIYTWLFNNTKGSVLIAALFHATANYTMFVLPTEASVWINTLLLLLAVILIVIVFGPNLVGQPEEAIGQKQTQAMDG